MAASLFGPSAVWAQPTAARPAALSPLIAPPAAEGPEIGLTLPEAVSLGLRDNRSIRSAYLQRITEKFNLRVAEDKFSPKLTIASSYLLGRTDGVFTATRNATPIVTLNLPTGAQLGFSWDNRFADAGGVNGHTSSSTLNLTLIQPLLRGGGEDAATASVRIGRLDERLNRLTLKTTVSQAVTTIILAYRDFLRAQEQLKIARDALQRSRGLLDVNRALIAAGRMADAEIFQTEADVASQELSVEEAINQVEVSRLALLSQIAIDLRTNLASVDRLTAEPVGVDIDRALAIALENQPDYLAQLLVIERARISLAVAKDQRLWDLSLVGGSTLGRDSQSGGVESSTIRREHYAGLQLVIPLGDLTAEQGEVAAGVAVRTADLRLDEIRQQIEQRVRDAVRNVQTRWRQLEIARRARDLAVKKLDAERQKLQVGRSSNFQVLSFENDLRLAESARLNAMISYLNALTILDQQLGTTLDTWQIALED